MALSRYKLVGDTKAVFYNGDTIPVDKIDDALADKLYGKTHVLERIAPEHAPGQLALAEASEPTTAQEPTTPKKND
jgi:hypothetical protein